MKSKERHSPEKPCRVLTPLKTGAAAFKSAFFPILLFEICYLLAVRLVFWPLLSLLLQSLMSLRGDLLAFNDGIWRFVFSAPGAVAVIVLAIMAALFVYFEFSVLISLLWRTVEGQKPDVGDAIAQSVWSLASLKSPTTGLFCLYALLLIPLVPVGITSSLLPALEIPNFIIGELFKTSIGRWGVFLAAISLILLFFLLLYVMPTMMVDRDRFSAAVKKSVSVIKAYGWRMLVVIFLIIALWVVFFLLPRLAFRSAFGTMDAGLREVFTQHGFSLRTAAAFLVWLLGNLMFIVHTPLTLSLLTATYLPLGERALPDANELEKIRKRLDAAALWFQRGVLRFGKWLRKVWRRTLQIPLVRKHKKLLAVALLAAICATMFVTLSGAHPPHSPIVIGHRGSAYAIENTLEAIDYAIEANADFAEVDIMLSADNVPVAIHDPGLNRLSGQNLNVYDLDADRLQEIALVYNGMESRIPTLQQVVDYCEGKIRLAVELKLHGREQGDIVTQAMEVIKSSSYQDDCMFLSLDYEIVRRLKEEYPEYVAGYCVYGNIGRTSAGDLNDLGVDFLLIEEAMVTRSFVRTCNRAELPVYVWTVNNRAKMTEYLKLGVCGLVTDYPDLGMEALAEGGWFSR